AIILWERVRQIPGAPDDVRNPILFNIGLANLRLQRYATAIKYFEDYLAVPGGSRQDDAFDFLEEARSKAGVPADASYDPDEAERVFLDGEAQFNNGNFAMAIILWERVRQIPGAPDDVRNPILFNIGLANLRLQRYATAIKYFEDYLAIPGGSREDDALDFLDEARTKAGVMTAL
ncbi:MAG TPA: tetratricopeptide repeat protein, partial [Dehalococcoidia bacterium]